MKPSRFPSSKLQAHVTKGRRVIELEADALRAVQRSLDGNFARAVEAMREVIQTGHKIIVTGIGKSGVIGAKIASTLSSTGASSVVLDAVNASHGDLGMVAGGDLVLILSYSGETEEISRLLPSLKRIGTRVVAMTGNPKSTLAREAEIHLDVQVPREACPLNLAPTSSSTAMLAVGDALAMVLLEARGFRKEDFATFHPGGTLGRNLLLKVEDIMRSREQMAILSGLATVNEALDLIARKRAGAVAVTDKQGRLKGIYTHGDFTRGYQKDVHIGRARLADVMTPNPITVRVDKLAVEVLNLFEAHRIGDLIVVDRRNHPVGLVDAQDLAKVKLL
ncbi:MAG: KpsF/GutQ family sugar-phosphate isomerase [Methylacidiphilales bacterium]|nr:KpsF/GutQ family sugar-phosphate isomerase [Candidatus Methylacidiphilales bacterium]